MVDKRFKTGARRSPRFKLLAARPFHLFKAPPPQAAWAPKQLDMWGNNQYGDCVTAEEAFAKACDQPEDLFAADLVVSWARDHGFLDGADLKEVLDAMLHDGFVMGPKRYNDGPALGVDYSDEAVLQAAISTGPVKIAIDSNALPNSAGNQQGWSAFGGRPGQYGNTDHCVALCGYGPVAWLAQQLGVSAPSKAPTGNVYLLFTWSTIGFVDHSWVMSTCQEAWVRNPTTVTDPPTPAPEPTPTPTPTPTPAPSIWSIIWPLIVQYGPQIIAFLISLLHHAQSQLERSQQERQHE